MQHDFDEELGPVPRPETDAERKQRRSEAERKLHERSGPPEYVDDDRDEEVTEVDLLDQIHDRLQELDTTLDDRIRGTLADISKAVNRIANVAEYARWLLFVLTWGAVLLCIRGTLDLLQWLSRALR